MNGYSTAAESYGIPRAQDTGSSGTAPPPARRPKVPRPGGRAPLLGPLSAILTLWIACGLFVGCATTPITGKKVLIPFPASYDVQLGLQAIDEYVDDSKVIKSGPEAQMVQRVMDRLVAAAGDDAKGYEWSVRLVDEPQTVNAFALPGGPMAVYTGILPVTQTEAGLAVVMGHELGHVLARHGMQRMTRTQGASLLLSLFDTGEYAQLAQLGYQYAVELPFGRGDESESDHIGLILMAKAGYDPREAPRFWKRMAEMTGGSGGPEWLSTHPSNETRQEDLLKLLPKALKEYQGPKGDDLKQFDGR